MAPNHFFFLFEFVFEAEAGIAPDPGKLELSNWPIQMRLATVDAPYFDGARLLIAGDCTAFASPAVHRDYIRGGSPSSAAPSSTRGRASLRRWPRSSQLTRLRI